jgi:hypothetical protein
MALLNSMCKLAPLNICHRLETHFYKLPCILYMIAIEVAEAC